ncbi:hypothetical protein JCM10049v2_005231 [Rhodotorula toruloides]
MEGVQGDLKNPTTLATDPSHAQLSPTQPLPVETITHILAEGIHHRRKWSSISTLAKAFEGSGSDGCWESVRLREEDMWTAPMRSKKWKRVRRLDFSKGQSELPAAAEAVLKGLILPACTQLASLDLVVSPYILSDASPAQCAMPTLHSLSLTIRRSYTCDSSILLSDLVGFVSAFPNISTLTIRNPDCIVDGAGVEPIQLAQPFQLTSLALNAEDYDEMNDDCAPFRLSSLVASLLSPSFCDSTSLRSLSIGGSPHSLHSYVHAVTAFPRINKLSLVGLPEDRGSEWGFDSIPGSLVSFIVAILPRLQHLEIIYTESHNPEVGEPSYELLPTSTTHALLAALSASSSLTTFDSDLCVKMSAIRSGLQLLEGAPLKTMRWRLGMDRNEEGFQRVGGNWLRGSGVILRNLGVRRRCEA